KALEQDYWRRLIAAFPAEQTNAEFVGLDIASIAARFAVEGYFKTGAVLPKGRIEWMRRCVERLRSEKWPPVFAFGYDEFWTIAGTQRLLRLLLSLLGQGFRQNSNVWLYYITPHAGSSGWPPHIDGNGEQRLTIWVPLTDSTLENGCIYVVPRNLIPR